MLQFIRDRAHGWLAWTIIGLIIIPFALWGVNEYFGGGKEVPVASVNDADISQQQVQSAYWRQRERLQQMFGAAFRPELFPEEQMKAQVLQDLIRQELLVQAAGRAGMRVGDHQLAAAIRGIDAFQEDGSFSQAQYERLLSAQGMQPAYFEFRLRRDMVADQFSSGVRDTAFATGLEQNRYLSLSKQTRDVGYLLLPAERYRAEVEVSEQDLAAYYESHADEFMRPEQVRIAYLELDLDKLAAGIEVSEEEMRQRYESQLVNYRVPEERKARHILVTVEAAGDETAAKAKAEELQQQLRNGADFAALAKEHSQDPGSAAQGGDLGFFGRGVMDKAFEEAAFGLQPGEVSEPVRSAFGYHLIKVEEVKGGETKPYEQVRDTILAEIRKEKAEQVFYEQADQLANLSYEHPDNLQAAADVLGLPVQESDWVSGNGAVTGIAANPKVVAAAFDEDVLRSGNNSEVIELAPTRLAVVRVLEHRTAAQQPLAEVRERVEAAVRDEKAAAKARQQAEGALEALREGKEPEALAQELGLSWKRIEQLDRASGEVEPAIAEAVFAMPRPGSEPKIEQVALGDGGQAVVTLYGVTDGDPAKLDEADMKQAGQILTRAYGQAAFSGVMDAIRARSEIRVQQ